MDFTINKSNLIAAISKCEKAADSKHVTLAFRMMRVDVRAKTVKFVSVGEFCSVDTVAPAEAVKEKGVFNVSPQRLRDIVSSMPEGTVRLSMKGSRITVASSVSKRKATFENHTVDVYSIDDPGKEAPWIEMKARELVAALKKVRAASQWEDSAKPVVSLLVPSEAGIRVFGCNGYLITVVDTSMKLTCDKIRFPAKATDILELMATDDDNVRVFVTDSRLYLENCDTLVTAALPDYQFMSPVHAYLDMLSSKDNPRGPAMKLSPLHSGLKSVMAAAGFASTAERGSRGYQVKLHMGNDSVRVGLNLSEADSVDEFDTVKSGDEEFDVCVSSNFFDKLLNSLSGCEEVQSLLAGSDRNLLALRAQGIVSGIMLERETTKEP